MSKRNNLPTTAWYLGPWGLEEIGDLSDIAAADGSVSITCEGGEVVTWQRVNFT